jgi:hypothetical protein
MDIKVVSTDDFTVDVPNIQIEDYHARRIPKNTAAALRQCWV